MTIVVPTPRHFAVASRALERGKHVLIEKPITATLEEADALLAIAQRTGVIVQTGHVERFNRAIRAALPYVSNPRFIESDRLAPFNIRGSDVAVVLDLMIHDIDLILTLVNSGAGNIAAVGIPVLTPTVDIANARITFESGAVANITASRISRERVRKVRIFQPSGYLSLDLAAGNGEFFRLKKDWRPARARREREDAGSRGLRGAHCVGGSGRRAAQARVREFCGGAERQRTAGSEGRRRASRAGSRARELCGDIERNAPSVGA